MAPTHPNSNWPTSPTPTPNSASPPRTARPRTGPPRLTDHHGVAAATGSGPMLGGDQLLPGGDELLFNAEAGLLD